MRFPQKISQLQALIIAVAIERSPLTAIELGKELEEILMRPVHKGTLYPAIQNLANREIIKIINEHPMTISFVHDKKAITIVQDILHHLRRDTLEHIVINRTIAEKTASIASALAADYLNWAKSFFTTELTILAQLLEEMNETNEEWNNIIVE